MEPSRFLVRDLVRESLAGILQRPGRSALTALGTVLGVGAFVAILGLTTTTGGAINEHFDVSAATQVTVEDLPQPGQEDGPVAFPDDADERVMRVNGVRAGGVLWSVPLRGSAAKVTLTPFADATGDEAVPVVSASAGALRAVRPVLAAGRVFDRFHDGRGEPVAVVGRGVAAQLGIASLDRAPALFIGGVSVVVVGVLDDVERRTDLLTSIVVPRGFVQRTWGESGQGDRAQMLVETDLGAAQQVASELPLALRPDAPDVLRAIAPPDPRALRDQVNAEVNSLFLVLASISLVIGAVGIANTTLVAVLERVGEIGLRRALGARPRHVASQFLLESTTLGALGGLIGTTIGILTVVLISLARGWTPIMEPVTVLPAPVIGALVGLGAGLYPAWRAARIEPVEALRR